MGEYAVQERKSARSSAHKHIKTPKSTAPTVRVFFFNKQGDRKVILVGSTFCRS